MAIHTATSTPNITTHVRQLVVVLLCAATAVIGLILWQVFEHDKIVDTTMNYHIASSQSINIIHEETQLINKYINTILSQNTPGASYIDILQTNHNAIQSLQIIKQSANHLFSIQKKYQDPAFFIMTNQLKTQLDPFLSLIDANLATKKAESETDIINIDAILLTLKQLGRLHIIANSELTEKANRQEKNRTKIMLGVLLVVLLIGRSVVKNAFKSIRAILTKQKETENGLSQEKKLIHTTLNSIGDAVITTDKNGLVTNMNPVAERLTGWSLQEAQGIPLKTIFPIIDASTRKSIENPVEKVIATGETIYLSNHTTLIAKDGKEYQIADSAAPIRNDDQIFGMVLVFNDVTEQYQLRQAAAKSRRDLQAIMDNSPAVIYVKDISGRIIFANQQFGKLCQIQPNDIIGKTLHTVLPNKVAENMQRNDDAALAAGHALESEEAAPQKDGMHTYVSNKFPLFNDEGDIYAICGISTDITERKKMEEDNLSSAQHLRLYREQTPMATIEWNTDFQVLDWNRAAEKMFGYTLDEVKGRNFVDIMLPESAVVDVKQIWRDLMMQTGGEVSINENLTKDGRVILCEWHNTPLKNEAGKVIGAASIVQDITERKQQEEQLRRSQKMDALGKLTGGIAHDYNNLLGIIQGYAEQLNLHLGHDSKLSKYAQDIQRAAERGAKLTNKLLVFSRYKAADPTVLNINELLHQQQLMLEKILTARIKLVYDLAEDLWPVEFDSGDFEDAIVNMSINAMHAMSKDGELTFRTSNEQLNTIDAHLQNLKAGDYVLLSITDTGCGMNEATKEKIFDPYFTTKGERGTGLGLSQAYGFVERSGGVIQVYSELGYGSRFALYFPRSHRSVTEAQAPTIGAEFHLQGNETLLAVDDEQAMVELAHDILTAQGYRVLTANDGEQALAILEKESVDLIISDIIMPNMGGYDLAAQAQQRYPNIKIQMVSGFADDRHNTMVDATLHQNMLYKPYTSNTLLTHVRKLLDEGNTKDNLTNRTILIMDDDENVRELFKIHLSKLGCKTIEARDGLEAIALYQQSLEGGNTIDVIIVDLTIPGSMGGKEVKEKIRALNPHAKMIVSSGHSDGPEMMLYQNYGFQAALKKNFNRQKIQQALEQALLSN